MSVAVSNKLNKSKVNRARNHVVKYNIQQVKVFRENRKREPKKNKKTRTQESFSPCYIERMFVY